MKFGWKGILIVLVLVTLSAGVTVSILFSDLATAITGPFTKKITSPPVEASTPPDMDDPTILKSLETKEILVGDSVVVVFPLVGVPVEGDPKPSYLFRVGSQYRVEHRQNRLIAVGDNQITITEEGENHEDNQQQFALSPKTIFFRLTGDKNIMPLRPTAVNPGQHIGFGIEYDLVTHKATGVSWVPFVYLTDDKESTKDISINFGEIVEVNPERTRVTLSYPSGGTVKTKVLDISKTRLLNLPGQQ